MSSKYEFMKYFSFFWQILEERFSIFYVLNYSSLQLVNI
jgi:hypothetical protein